ncbi:ABC transporter permease [Bosea sp. (in: a-proteobacteria)]|uniref:ABC transporter permease n=1 Tax=Bosea sp. (in: a-proteobacteria) TaxID=1871050 RepID=UPI003B3B0790
MKPGQAALTAFAVAAFTFILAPILVVVLASVTPRGYLEFPPRGLSFRWYAEVLTSWVWGKAFLTSVALATVAATVTTFVCFLAALVTTRRRVPAKNLFELLVQLPLLLPHAALAMALFSLILFLGLRGSFPGLVLAHLILVMPFVYAPIVNGLRQHDLSVEEAAATLGADPVTVFRKITLPMLRPALVSAFLFSFIVSFDEVTVSVFLIGVDLTTLPVKILSDIQASASPAIAAVSTLLMGLTLIMVYVINRLVGLQLFIENRG